MKRLLENDDEEDNNRDFEYGDLKVVKVRDHSVFFKFLDELEAEHDKVTGRGFYGNRVTFLKAFMEKRLFTLHMSENDSMFRKGAQRNPLFIKNSFYELPILCVVTKERKDTVDILWTAKRARNKGFGTRLIELLNIRYVLEIVNNAEQFWENRGIVLIHGIKPPFASSSNYTHTNEESGDEDSGGGGGDPEELCDSSEEEDEVISEPLMQIMTYKKWLIGSLIEIKDVEQYITSLMCQVYITSVEFTCIDPSFWDSVHGVMSSERVHTQKVKQNLLQTTGTQIIDHPLYYGQIVADTKDIARNKVMMISRSYAFNVFTLQYFKEKLEKANLRVHFERMRYRNSPTAALVIIMDTGINMEKAIIFARSIDKENDDDDDDDEQ